MVRFANKLMNAACITRTIARYNRQIAVSKKTYPQLISLKGALGKEHYQVSIYCPGSR